MKAGGKAKKPAGLRNADDRSGALLPQARFSDAPTISKGCCWYPAISW